MEVMALEKREELEYHRRSRWLTRGRRVLDARSWRETFPRSPVLHGSIEQANRGEAGFSVVRSLDENFLSLYFTDLIHGIARRRALTVLLAGCGSSWPPENENTDSGRFGWYNYVISGQTMCDQDCQIVNEISPRSWRKWERAWNRAINEYLRYSCLGFINLSIFFFEQWNACHNFWSHLVKTSKQIPNRIGEPLILGFIIASAEAFKFWSVRHSEWRK